MGTPIRLGGGITASVHKPGTKPARHRVSEQPKRAKERLTDAQIRAAKPRKRNWKLTDGDGLYVLICANKSKLWRQDFYLLGKKRPYSIGAYPEITLMAARAERDRVREWVRQGLDPVLQRKLARSAITSEQATTFAAVSEEWFLGKKREWSAAHTAAQRKLLDRFLLPTLGAMPIGQIETPHVLEALRAIERIGAHELLAKSRMIAAQVFRYGIVTARCKVDPTVALAGAFTRPPVVNRATVEAAELPALFTALAAVPSELTTKLAFCFQMATAVRPGEVRFAPWSEIDIAKALWRIPAERMKMRLPFVQPLSPLALALLKRADELRQTHERDELIFPGFTRSGHLSENAFTALLARAGFYGRQTAHGMRAAFASWAHEEEFDPTAVELCLAHRPGGVAGIYNRAEYLKARLDILTAWGGQLTAWGMRLP